MTVAQIVWTVAIVGFLLLELATPSALVSIWFMAGSVAALLVSLFCPVFWVQTVVFLVVTVVTLVFTRPLVVKKVKNTFLPTNADQVVGMKGRVLVEIRPNEVGRIHVNGLDWAARANETLPEGSWCVVERINGATLTVHKAEEAQYEEVTTWNS